MANKHLLNNEQGYDQKALKRYIDSQQSKELKNNSQRAEEFIASHASDHDVALYHHYTIINGKKYHLTLTGDRKELLRCIELEASNDAEENNPLLIPYPICATNWIGVSDDPFGVNIFDILADKQMALQTFDNLARINAEFAVFGDKFLVDENMVQDISLLIQDTQGPTYIPYK